MIKRILKWFKFLVLIAWIILMFVIGMWILSENTTQVKVTFFGFVSGEETLGWVLFLTLFAGWCLGFVTTALAGWSSSFWQRRKLHAAQKALDRLNARQKTL